MRGESFGLEDVLYMGWISDSRGQTVDKGVRIADSSVRTSDNRMPTDLMQARIALESLVIYRQLLQDQTMMELHLLLDHLCLECPDIFQSIALYSSLCHKLLQVGTDLKSTIAEKIIHMENAFSRAAEVHGAECLKESMEAAVKGDLMRLQTIADLKAEQIKNWIIECCAVEGWQAEAVLSLPVFPESCSEDTFSAVTMSCSAAGNNSYIESISTGSHYSEVYSYIVQSACWADCSGELAEYHHYWGSGVFSQHKAFVWRRNDRDGCFGDGYFDGVKSPDPITFSNLISYELERESVIENTLRFLEGYPANNILLYGDRGTGKSSTVKALVNEYYNKGLRIIEVPKQLLTDFPAIIGQLAGRNLKFILFVDDLAFEDNEENYTALKAVLEGGLESRPKNVLIYATSNRKHLIKEKFSDRSGLVSSNADDEVRAADTIQEKLSLSDRFGMTVVFSSPNQKRYLEIVEGIIRGRGIQVDTEMLHREALRWELRYNGRSPRTAKQFADWLEGHIAASP